MNAFLSSGSFLNRNVLLLFCSIYYTSSTGSSTTGLRYFNSTGNISTKDFNADVSLTERFKRFAPVSTDAEYTITICADIPDNSNTERVNVGQQPGHVFLILEKLDAVAPYHQTIQVFGFYPNHEHSSLIAGDVPCKIRDNSKREYNASLTKKLNSKEFQLLLEKAEQLALKKYNLRRFNCYDYVLAIFNSIPGIEKLPITHTRLPYFLGSAGSPCGLYRDLKRLKDNQSEWAPYIQFGIFTAPESSVN